MAAKGIKANNHDRLQRNIRLYNLSKFLFGFRFHIPIWMTFGKRLFYVSQLSFWDAMSFVVTIILELPSGALADLIGRKRTVTIGWILTACFHIGLAFSDTQSSYVFWILLGGIGSAMISGADTALVYDSLVELKQEGKFSKVLGTANLLNRVSIVIASFTGGLLYNYNIRLPYILLGSVELVVIILWSMMKEPSIDTVKFTVSNYYKQIVAGIKEAFANTYTSFLSIYYMLVGGFTLSHLYFFGVSFSEDLGFDAIGRSVLFGIVGIAKGVFVYLISRRDKPLKKKYVYILFPIFMIIGFVPAYWVLGLVGALLILILDVIAIARFVVLDPYVNENFSSSKRATALSFLNMSVSFVGIIIMIFGGRFVESNGTAMWYTVLGVLTALLVLPLGIILAKKHVK